VANTEVQGQLGETDKNVSCFAVLPTESVRHYVDKVFALRWGPCLALAKREWSKYDQRHG
jgi:hypothetical protein